MLKKIGSDDFCTSARARLGWSQAQAAQAAGLSRRKLQLIEHGDPRVPQGDVQSLVAALQDALASRGRPETAAAPQAAEVDLTAPPTDAELNAVRRSLRLEAARVQVLNNAREAVVPTTRRVDPLGDLLGFVRGHLSSPQFYQPIDGYRFAAAVDLIAVPPPMWASGQVNTVAVFGVSDAGLAAVGEFCLLQLDPPPAGMADAFHVRVASSFPDLAVAKPKVGGNGLPPQFGDGGLIPWHLAGSPSALAEWGTPKDVPVEPSKRGSVYHRLI